MEGLRDKRTPSEKVGVVSVVFVSTEEEKIRNKLKKLQDKNPEKFYMEYVTPLGVDGIRGSSPYVGMQSGL